MNETEAETAITLRDVVLGDEEALLAAALRERFVLGYGQAELRLAMRLYTTPPYRSARAVAKMTYDLVLDFATRARKESK